MGSPLLNVEMRSRVRRNEEGSGQAEVEKGNMPAMTAVTAARMMLWNGTDDQSSMQPRGRGDQGLSSRRPAWPWKPVGGVFRQ